MLDLVIATRENTEKLGYFVDDTVVNPGLGIPYYKTVIEGANYEHADWKDQACVRTSQIHWRDDHNVSWLERHLEMTQAFIVIGKNPGLFVLGEPTHDREDLEEKQRALPDPNRVKAYIIPAGMGLILKKGTWHDFPVSCGPPLSAFIINTEEVVEALATMPQAAPMNHGDCYKLRLSEQWDFTLRFPDPRPFIQKHGLAPQPFPVPLMGQEGYGAGMHREEVAAGWAKGKKVVVVPVVNVEVFVPGSRGPAIQPHLQSTPEVANRGWRDYGNTRGLKRLVEMFKELGLPATAVINSEAVKDEDVAKVLKGSGWEFGAHGLNNSSGASHMSRQEEEAYFKQTLDDLQETLGSRPQTWLTPGFSVTERTPEIAAKAGIQALLDFVDDDVPFYLKHEEAGRTLCLPYCMETNDFSCVLAKQLDARQYVQTIEDHVRQLAKEEGEKVVCLGMHTFVAGTPARVLALTETLQRLRELPGVAFATAAQAPRRRVGACGVFQRARRGARKCCEGLRT
ncbi:Chitin deacetylase 1 [Durusdinium trenchii]|uniref:Chitin deacetylase 1 n=1 Tax=Durusdinium trenchii TaxID=1381693 RepID=A0ABP0LE61_9DINO